MTHARLVVLLIGCWLLSACIPSAGIPQPAATAVIPPTVPATLAPTAPPAPTETAAPADTPAPSATPAPSDTPAPSATTPPTLAPTPAPSATTAPAAPATVPGGGGQTEPYLDDRSTAAALMQSYVNALNSVQYLRAYSYWNASAPQLQPFTQFAAGFSITKSTRLALGAITGDAGAGQLYYSVPASLTAQTTGGATQTFVGCYILHLSQPGIQGVPPFQPLSFASAQVKQVANNANIASLLAQACKDSLSVPLQVTPAPAPDDISPTRYLDDRSDAVQVLRSLFNAVNRKEYVRAYSYWEPNAQGLPSFDQFQQGYANTSSVQLKVGTVLTGAGAGQRYYQVPVTLVSTTTAHVTQTFVGCYTLHLALPDAQGVPPYQGIGIRSAVVQKVANNADTAALMTQACK